MTTPQAQVPPGSASPAIPADPVPMVHLKVLIISGQHHVFSFEPETTVGRMKELVWSMWPSAPAQPPAPSWLRVLYAGRVLSDDSTLAANNLPVARDAAQPTVIHLSVRSFSIRGDDDAKKGCHRTNTRASARSEHARTNQEENVGGCRCVIM